jgi:hypothetical protein
MSGRKHKIELFTDGDPMSWKVAVFDAKKVTGKAKKLGIRSLPAIVVDGEILELNLEALSKKHN